MHTILAAIDIGSNAIRLVIADRDEHGEIRVLKKVREPVRLGADVFATGGISPKTREKALATFVKFRDLLALHKVERSKAVATSALREANNSDDFIKAVHEASGIKIELIDGLEEGRLVFSAVAHRMNLDDNVALLIDIGGGSVELTVADHGVIRASESFKLGTVRLLQMLEEKQLKEKHLRFLLDTLTGPMNDFLKKMSDQYDIDFVVGTGGNFECLGKLRVALLHKNSIFSMTKIEVGQLVDHLQTMSVKERIQFLRLRPDRADVVIPAAHVTQIVMDQVGVDVLMIPYVGLRDGILTDLSETNVATISIAT